MGGAKRQLEEYEEFLVNRPPVHMNADTQANILAMAVEATRLELERTRMQLEDQQAKIVECTDKLTEEVSFLDVSLYRRTDERGYLMWRAADTAMNILHPGHSDY